MNKGLLRFAARQRDARAAGTQHSAVRGGEAPAASDDGENAQERIAPETRKKRCPHRRNAGRQALK